jgi:imidazoleglycerol-phosphate dehydratase
MRSATIERLTHETQIRGSINLDGTGAYQVSTGIGFLDHMIEQLSRHSLIDIALTVAGDLHIDQHHTVEDSALALGKALAEALGEKRGIARYGEAHAPMDETLTRCALDISGRPHFIGLYPAAPG